MARLATVLLVVAIVIAILVYLSLKDRRARKAAAEWHLDPQDCPDLVGKQQMYLTRGDEKLAVGDPYNVDDTIEREVQITEARRLRRVLQSKG
jgi:flagellar biosynthesis/type III secretory pathway M-ring protein FliF/YscJ